MHRNCVRYNIIDIKKELDKTDVYAGAGLFFLTPTWLKDKVSIFNLIKGFICKIEVYKNTADRNWNPHIDRKSTVWENILNFYLISELSTLYKSERQWHSTKCHHCLYKKGSCLVTLISIPLF